MSGIGLTLALRREARLRRWTAVLVAKWRQAQRRREMRRYIMEMDERTLSDIGISRAQALFEIDRTDRHAG